MDIQEKIKKDQETLTLLKEKREKLNEKIKRVEERIDRNTTILNDMRFTELNNVIRSKGLNIDEILEAVRTGDLLSIQDKLMQEDEGKSDVEGGNNEVE